MQPRFHSGTFLGRRFETNELLIALPSGDIVKARDFKDVPDADAWNKDSIEKITGTPYQPATTIPMQVYDDDERLPFLPEVTTVNGEPTTRGFILRGKHFARIGYTAGCKSAERCRMV